MSFHHIPVMLEQCVEAVEPQGATVVDCTLGGGGHSLAFLQAGAKKLIGLDRDEEALQAATDRLGEYSERVQLVHSDFGGLLSVLEELEVESVDAIFADIGVSSHQIDTADRGFSFRFDGPLDMRMDRSSGTSAAELVNNLGEEELANLIYKYGEDKRSRRIARAIVQARPFHSTLALANCIASACPRRRGQRIHPATRTFQALRIEVNDELGQLRKLLHTAKAVLRPGGRLAILTFHSLEDRMVKRFIRDHDGSKREKDPYGNPIGTVAFSRGLSLPPSSSDPNPRARSARLRVTVRQ